MGRTAINVSHDQGSWPDDDLLLPVSCGYQFGDAGNFCRVAVSKLCFAGVVLCVYLVLATLRACLARSSALRGK